MWHFPYLLFRLLNVLCFIQFFSFGSVVDFVIAKTFLILSILDFLVWTLIFHHISARKRSQQSFFVPNAEWMEETVCFNAHSKILCHSIHLYSEALQSKWKMSHFPSLVRTNPKMNHVNYWVVHSDSEQTIWSFRFKISMRCCCNGFLFVIHLSIKSKEIHMIYFRICCFYDEKAPFKADATQKGFVVKYKFQYSWQSCSE